MGISYSSREGDASETISDGIFTPERLFSLDFFESLKKEFSNGDPLKNLGKPVTNQPYLDSVIEKIYINQNNFKSEKYSSELFETTIYDSIVADSEKYLNNAKLYQNYFDHITELITKTVDQKENIIDKNFVNMSEQFISVRNMKEGSNLFLESVLSTSFEVLFDDLDCLEVDDVVKFLGEFLSFLQEDNEHNIVNVSSPVIQSFHRFALNLGKFEKFQTQEIKTLVITFLFQLGLKQKNICSCISAILYLLVLHKGTKITYDAPDFWKELGIEKRYSNKDKEGFRFYTVNIEMSPSGTRENILETSLISLSSLLDDQIEGILNKDITKVNLVYSFIVESTEEVIDLSLLLVDKTLKCTDLKIDVRGLLISSALQITSLNLFKYSFNFTNHGRSIEGEDSKMFCKIIDSLNQVLSSDVLYSSPRIIETFVTILSFSFRYLYFPRYNILHESVKKILSSGLSDAFMYASITLVGTSCLLYIFSSEFSNSLEQCFPPETVHQFFLSAIDLLPSELRFLEDNNCKQNEECLSSVVRYYMRYVSKLFDKQRTAEGIELLKHIVFGIVNIQQFPLISETFLSEIDNILCYLHTLSIKHSEIVKSDQAFLKVIPGEFQVKEKIMRIETPHNYPDNYFQSWDIDFAGASGIHIEFDSKCHTQHGADVFNIYDSLKNGNLIHSFSGDSNNWPSSIDIPFNQVLATFSSDQSINFWGVKCEVSGNISKQMKLPTIGYELFLLNFLYYTIGRMINVALQSIPVFKLETKQKSTLESCYIQSLLNSKNYPDIDYVSFIESDELRSFISYLDNKIKNKFKSKYIAVDQIKLAEKYVVYAFLSKLDLLTEYKELVRMISNNISPEVPSIFKSIYNNVNNILLTLFRLYQQLKESSVDPSKSVGNYTNLVDEIIYKSKRIIASSETEKIILKREDAIFFYKQFLISETKLIDLENIHSIRSKRIKLRKNTVDFITRILTGSYSLDSSIANMIIPVKQNLSIIFDKSYRETELQELYNSFIKLFESVVNRIVTACSLYLSLLLINIISIPLHNALSPSTYKLCIEKFLDYTNRLNTSSSIEEFTVYQNVWKSIAVWISKYPCEIAVAKLIYMTSDNSKVSNQHYSFLVYYFLIHSRLVPRVDVNTLIQNWSSVEPKVAGASLMCLFAYIINYGGKDTTITLCSKKLNVTEFLILIIDEMESLMTLDNSHLFKSTTYEANLYLLQELISFIRILQRPLSNVSNIVTQILHDRLLSLKALDLVNISEQEIRSAILTFTILGLDFTIFGKGFYCVYTADKVNPCNSNVLSFDGNKEIKISSGDSIIETNTRFCVPSSKILCNPIDFIISKEEMNVINSVLTSVYDFYSKQNKYIGTPIINNFIIVFLGFLSVSLQNENNMNLFLETCDFSTLFNLATSYSDKEFTMPLGQLINSMKKYQINIKKLKSRNLVQSQDTILPYSLVFDTLGTTTLVPLRMGVVAENLVRSSPKDESIFVGNQLMPPEALFYFEIKIKTISNQNFIVGILEEDSDIGSPMIYGFDFKKGMPIARFLKERSITETVKIKAGDVIGCGYTRNSIVYFLNGNLMKTCLPVMSFSSFVPIIITNRCPISFEYNFGRDQFVSDVISSPLFDIKSDCLYKVEVPVPATSSPYPSGMDVSSFINELSNSSSHWETPKQYGHEKNSYFHTYTENNNSKSDVFSEYYLTDQCFVFKSKFFLGQSVKLSRSSLNSKQTGSYSFSTPSLDVLKKINSYGIITEVTKDKSNENDILTVEICEPENDAIFYVKVDSRFVDPISKDIREIIENCSLRRLSSNQFSSESRYEIFVNLNRCHNLISKEIIHKLSRSISLNIIDNFRINNRLDSDYPLSKVLVLAITECSKFSHEVYVNNNWKTAIAPTDYFYIDLTKSTVSTVLFKYPGDLKRYNWFLKAFFLADGVSSSRIIKEILQICMNGLSEGRLSTNEDLFDYIRSSMVIETWHPMPITTINRKFSVGPDIAGIIPIIHTLQNIESGKGVLIGKCEVFHSNSEILMITSDFEVTYEGRENKDSYGVKIGFFEIPTRIPVYLAFSTIGSVHCLMYMLSLLLTSEINDDIIHFLKTDLFTHLCSVINCGNIIADVFVSSIIAPILTSIKWSIEDLTEDVEASFRGFSDKFERTVTEWTELSVHAQKALVMSVFTKLLALDTHASSINDNDEEKIGELYDTYIKAKSLNKDTVVFQQIIHAFSIICALGFGRVVPVKFPSFLLADVWAESFNTNETTSLTTRSNQAKRKTFIDNYPLFKSHMDFMANNWNILYDETIRRIIKTNPELLTMVPLVIPDTVLASNASIAVLDPLLLRCRIYLFQCIDEYITDVNKIVEFGNRETLLGDLFSSCRAAVDTQFKMKLVEDVVLKDIDNPLPLRTYNLNRYKAALFKIRPTNPNSQSLLSQFIQQTPMNKLSSLKRSSVPWRVNLINEGAIDLGGPGRDVFSELCMELMHPSHGLFIETPNGRAGNRTELLIPNPVPLTSVTKKYYFYTGVLMTLCYTSRLPEPFRFARFVWNALTGRNVTIEDIYEIDFSFQRFISSIENCSNSEEFQKMFDIFFTCPNTIGEYIELIPGGSHIPVTFERRFEYIIRCQKFRRKEFNDQINALREGFYIFFPKNAVSILAPWELELVICGDNECPIDILKRNCSYPQNDTHSDMLWSVLETFTPVERMLFIKFGTGKMGLPPPGTKNVTPLQIQFKLSEVPDELKPLPTSQTCNFLIVIPRYSTPQAMAKKIKTAITFGADIQDQHANPHAIHPVG